MEPKGKKTMCTRPQPVEWVISGRLARLGTFLCSANFSPERLSRYPSYHRRVDDKWEIITCESHETSNWETYAVHNFVDEIRFLSLSFSPTAELETEASQANTASVRKDYGGIAIIYLSICLSSLEPSSHCQQRNKTRELKKEHMD